MTHKQLGELRLEFEGGDLSTDERSELVQIFEAEHPLLTTEIRNGAVLTLEGAQSGDSWTATLIRKPATTEPTRRRYSSALANLGLSKGVRRVRSAQIYRFWELTAWILPPETRRRVFEPALEDLKQEHSKARKKYRGKWQRRWLWFCFNFNSLRLFPQCWRCWVCAKVLVLLKVAASLLGLG